MKAIKNTAGLTSRLATSLLRRVEDIVSHEAFAGYTFSGPGSLATGQGGHFRHADYQVSQGETAGIEQRPGFDESASPCQGYA